MRKDKPHSGLVRNGAFCIYLFLYEHPNTSPIFEKENGHVQLITIII